MRLLIFFVLSLSTVYSLDYSNMYFTPEPFNMYSEDAYPDEIKDGKRSNKKDTKKAAPKFKNIFADGGPVYYAFMLGLQNQSAYDRFGYALSASITKSFPKMMKNAPGLCAEADLLLNIKAMKDSNALLSDSKYSYASVYAAYLYPSGEKTILKPKIGFAYGFSPLNHFKFSYGVSIIRQLKTDRYKLIADVSVMQDVWHISAGARFTYQEQ